MADGDIVDLRTGEVATPGEVLEQLRVIERTLVRIDEEICRMQDDLKATRAERERLVGELRACVRKGTVLPLFDEAS